MRALVVGRTMQDLQECQRFNLPNHEPAPSTYLFTDYAQFDGDVITAHTVKFGAKYACAVEFSRRVAWSALENPGKVNLAFAGLQHIGQIPHEYHDAMTFWPPQDHEYPNFSSGIFAIWFALMKGYDEVYTVGIDQRRIRFTNGFKYDHGLAAAYVKAVEDGGSLEGFRMIEDIFTTTAKDDQAIESIELLKKRFPDQQIYKTAKLSQMPVPVCFPPTRGQGGSA